MIVIAFLLMGGIWWAGHHFGLPKWQRWTLIAGLIVSLILQDLMSAINQPGRRITDGSARDWIALLAFGFLVAGYRALLPKLKMRIAAKNAPVVAPAQGVFSQSEVQRYARHIVLREIGGPGQRRLKEAKVLVVGAGGLGSPALVYLAAAGVGTIGIIDNDTVDESNLQRQVIHSTGDHGRAKVASAADAIQRLNPYVTVKTYARPIDDSISDSLIADYDVVLDGTDNFETRYLVNAACVANGKPLISGALSQWEGQVSVFSAHHDAPCYQCIFPAAPSADLAPSCAEAGVFSPLPGVIGTMMAAEALKVITGAGTPLFGRMIIYDALDATMRTLKLKRNVDCSCCGTVRKELQ